MVFQYFSILPAPRVEDRETFEKSAKHWKTGKPIVKIGKPLENIGKIGKPIEKIGKLRDSLKNQWFSNIFQFCKRPGSRTVKRSKSLQNMGNFIEYGCPIVANS